MPFVRFSRDRRGYEHVYLVDNREHGRSRVIFWFRTPPGVKVVAVSLPSAAMTTAPVEDIEAVADSVASTSRSLRAIATVAPIAS